MESFENELEGELGRCDEYGEEEMKSIKKRLAAFLGMKSMGCLWVAEHQRRFERFSTKRREASEGTEGRIQGVAARQKSMYGSDIQNHIAERLKDFTKSNSQSLW